MIANIASRTTLRPLAAIAHMCTASSARVAAARTASVSAVPVVSVVSRPLHVAPAQCYTMPSRPAASDVSSPAGISVPQQGKVSGNLGAQEYHNLADATLDALQDKFDALIERVPDLISDTYELEQGDWDLETAVRVLHMTYYRAGWPDVAQR